MYRGKFQSDNRAGNPVRRDPTPPRTTRPAQSTGAGASRPVSQTASRQTAPARSVPQPAPKKKGSRVGTTIFYTVYFLLIVVFAGGMFLATRWLQGWLVDYEASQPTVKSQEVFDQLFANPDWAALYRQAGIQDTPYEGADAYVSYMQEKTAGKELTYTRISRALLHTVLGIKQKRTDAFLNDQVHYYAHLLGFRKDQKQILSVIKKESDLLLFTRTADEKKLSKAGKAMRRQDVFASNLYQALISGQYHTPFENDLKKSVLKI